MIRPEGGLAVRPATSIERNAIRHANWPALPPWAWEIPELLVAVTGNRQLLHGCAWRVVREDENGRRHMDAGSAFSPASARKDEVGTALARRIAEAADDPLPWKWRGWLEREGPVASVLLENGFDIEEEFLIHEIPVNPAGRARLERHYKLLCRIPEESRHPGEKLRYEDFDEVREICLGEMALTRDDVELLLTDQLMVEDLSLVVRAEGKIVGLLLAYRDGDSMHGPVRFVAEGHRHTLMNARLLVETYMKWESVDPDGRWIRFRSNRANHAETARLCERFGGREQGSLVRLVRRASKPCLS